MKKKVFIVPNNDAEAIRIQKLIKENNQDGNYEIIITGQDWGASWEQLEPEIKAQLEKIDNTQYEVYGIELKGNPQNQEYHTIDHHKYYDSDVPTAIGEKTSIEQMAEILGVELSVFDRMIAANDVGYIPKMIKMATQLNLSEEEKAKIIEEIDRLEGMGKVPSIIGKPRNSLETIEGIEELAKQIKDKNKTVAQNAIDSGYVYDDRLIWIDLEDFNCQREVTNLLYQMGKYRDMSYNNIIVSSIDKGNNRRLVYFGDRELIDKLSEQFSDVPIKWTGGEPEAGFFGLQISNEPENSDKSVKEFKEKSNRMRYFLEEEILGYHRIVTQEDIISSEETPKYR